MPYHTLACERTKDISSDNSGDVSRASWVPQGPLPKRGPGTVLFMQVFEIEWREVRRIIVPIAPH